MPKRKSCAGSRNVGEDPSRIVFPEILNAMELFGIGAEIGVFRGWHANLILDAWETGTLYAVDPWIQAPMFRDGINIDPVGHGWKREELMQTYRADAERLLKRYVDIGRCVILPMTSAEASKQFSPGTLDWVYIDGRHYREGVTEDLDCWYPLVKHGGVVGGHDYNDQPRHFFEVKSTVDAYFSRKENVITLDTKPVLTWYLIKGYPNETGTRPIAP
jgi:hypothetical protein